MRHVSITARRRRVQKSQIAMQNSEQGQQIRPQHLFIKKKEKNISCNVIS